MQNSLEKVIPTGIAGLDEILYGGIPVGNTVLVEGEADTRKTTFGLHFVCHGAAAMGQPGLLISFERAPDKIARDAAGFGWDLYDLQQHSLLTLILTSPSVLVKELSSHDSVLYQEIQRIQATRIFIDGLSPLKVAAEHSGEQPFREVLQLLSESLERTHATTVMASELPGGHNTRVDFGHEAFVADSVIFLRQEAMTGR